MYNLTEFYNTVVPEDVKQKYNNLSRFSEYPPELLWEADINPTLSYLKLLKEGGKSVTSSIEFPDSVFTYLPEGVDREVAEQWRIKNLINLLPGSLYDARIPYGERKRDTAFFDVIVTDMETTPSRFFKDFPAMYSDTIKYINMQDEMLREPVKVLATPESLEVRKVNFGINPTNGMHWLDYVSPVNEVVLAGTIMLKYINKALSRRGN